MIKLRRKLKGMTETSENLVGKRKTMTNLEGKENYVKLGGNDESTKTPEKMRKTAKNV
jgi:hypothetical protein